MKKTLKTASAAALLAAMFTSPTFAQTADAGADANRAEADRPDVIGDPEDDGFDDWGLLGLLGLAGLMRRPKQDVVVRQDYNQTNPPR